MAMVSYLIAPAADAASLRARSRVPGRFDRNSPRRWPARAAARFCRATRIELLNNGDAFYPPMLEAIKQRHGPRSRSRPISTGPATSASEFAVGAGGARGGGSSREDPAGRRRIVEHRRRDPGLLEAGGCQVAWYNPIRWYTLGRFNNRTHRKSLIIDGRVAFTGGAGIADHWRGNARDPTNGATCRSGSKDRPSSRCRPGSRTTGSRRPASSSPAMPTTRRSSQPGRWRCRRS